jgi:hypothetical protein
MFFCKAQHILSQAQKYWSFYIAELESGWWLVVGKVLLSNTSRKYHWAVCTISLAQQGQLKETSGFRLLA